MANVKCEEVPLNPITMEAEGTITQYMVVMTGTAYPQVKPPTGANVLAFGVALADASDGEAVEVQPLNGGIVQVIAKAAISYGDQVVVNGTAGKVKTAPHTADTVENVIGIALGAPDTDTDRLPILTGISICDYNA